MGCLNDEGQFSHWFGNIHLSGPCNRSCYFCIGQHMMGLDQENSLKKIPTNIGKFLRECMERKVVEICMTGTNTDPLLYKKTFELLDYIRYIMNNRVPIAIRTNGIAYDRNTFGSYDVMQISRTFRSMHSRRNLPMFLGIWFRLFSLSSAIMCCPMQK